MTEGNLSEIERELRKLPSPVLEEFKQARGPMETILGGGELSVWAREGLSIASQSVRSWEAAVEFFKRSPDVAKLLPFASFIQWARCGSYLCQESPLLATAYFRASPGVVGNIRPQYIPKWASLGRNLYKGSWKSSTLAARFFEMSPTLVRELPFWDVELFALLIEALSYKSYDVALECLLLGQDVLSRMGKEREAFLSLARTLVECNWRDVKGCFEVVLKALASLEDGQRWRFIRLAEWLARNGHKEASSFLLEGAQALGRVDNAHHRYILDLCENLLPLSQEAVYAFLKSLPYVLGRINLSQLEAWFHQGSKLLRENPEGGLAYFKLESSTSERVLETLSSSVELERVKEIMRLYCRALAGANVQIQSTKELVNKGIGWVSEERASTEGNRVFLPPVVERYADKGRNFAWLKVVATHQVAHLEFGSFAFSFERPSILFKDLRPQMKGHPPSGDGSTPQEEGWLTDMARFFDLFEDRRLAHDIFTAVEDGRLDFRVKFEYRGIAPDYRRVQMEALSERPALEELPLREAMVEFLVRLSLQQFRGLPAPSRYLQEARVIARIMKQLLTPRASVEDSAEATIRIYRIISSLPNQEVPTQDWQTQDFEEGEYSEEEFEELLERLQATPRAQEQGEEPYESPPGVEYRGDFKPEIVQLLSRLRMQQGQGKGPSQGQPISREMLEQLLSQSAELELDAEAGRVSSTMGLFVQNLMKEAGVTPPPSQPGKGYGPIVHEEEQGGPLEAREPRTFVYDEWDFRALDYKPRWCIVREKVMEQGDVHFFNEALRNYRSLMNEIRRQFELVIPESFRKIRRLKDGEDLELDASIEALIDKRSGITPTDKVYWRRNKVERDVAVVFLLDMSASTAEAIDEGRHAVDDQDAPDDPVEYMLWLRTRRDSVVRRHYKRIIDLEKESTVLLIQALETIGDTYGIYGFSGYGRENVEFYIIKDIDEAFSDKVKRRLDKITPLHATRMGPAIRHATSKLEKEVAKTKLLFLISDGRPQDRGYSREGVEKEYAVHDTHMALMEARRKNITPFCLTVDKNGHDYLKTMCGDLGYEVLADIWSLPRRLPMLYRRLTI